MNQIHGAIRRSRNDDFLYVLSAMVLEPLRWNERFGWRRLLEAERQAAFHFWRSGLPTTSSTASILRRSEAISPRRP